MQFLQNLHSWKVTPIKARLIQDNLKDKIILENTLTKVNIIAGVDVCYNKDSNKLYGVVVNLKFNSLEIIEVRKTSATVTFPYVPGLLSFREGDCILKTFERLEIEPDVIIFDGQGIAHPKRLGIATHLGLWLNKPTIGCAKSRLVGEYKEPEREKGSYSYLKVDNEIVGAVLCTRTGVKPVFISPGFKIDLATSLKIVLSCCKKYRLPEPIRQAHILAGRQKIVSE
ncbi:MAG: deoxyribonuclease V [bacterium]